MRKTSLAHAKAHLSELVDAAEHHGKRIVILRRGKPVAVIVPVGVAIPPQQRRTRSTSLKDAQRSIRVFIEEFSAVDPLTSAVADLDRGRR